MKETDFIAQNKQKWQDLEKELLRDGDTRPDTITHLYIDSVDDLSYARTNYPNRLVRAYLNGAVEVLSLKIQKSQRNYWRNFKNFWLRDLPLAMFEGRTEFLISLLILALSIAIGIFSSMHDESFAPYILGEGYVAETIANIEKGDPMAIYKDDAMGDMFFRITINNILVSARTFILSLFFGFGTILVMIYNGIMIGVFQYFFIERGLFFESFLTIWQHGIIEISCIVLAGSAGLVLARGILFPGSYSRLDSFRLKGRKSLMIMLGLMPLLVFSGAIEAFVTRFTDVHWTIRLTSILMSLGFVISYFVLYPRRVAKEIQDHEPDVVPQPMAASYFTTKAIQSSVSIFWESIRVLFDTKHWLGRILVLLCAVISAIWWWFGVNPDDSISSLLSEANLSLWYVETGSNVLLIGTSFLITSTALLFAHWAVFNRISKEQNKAAFTFSRQQAVLVSLVLSIIYTASFVNVIVAIFLALALPVIGLFLVSIFHSVDSEEGMLKRALPYIKSGYGRMLLILSFFGFALLLSAGMSNMVFQELISTFLDNFVVPGGSVFLGHYLIPGLFGSISLFLVTALVYISMHLAYFSLLETQTARVLTQRIEDTFPLLENNVTSKVSILRKQVFST